MCALLYSLHSVVLLKDLAPKYHETFSTHSHLGFLPSGLNSMDLDFGSRCEFTVEKSVIFACFSTTREAEHCQV